MKLALLGRNISHSRSPEFYRQHVPGLERYDIFDVEDKSLIPGLNFFKRSYLGINITSPYKEFFNQELELEFPKLAVINCIDLRTLQATNTDLKAIIQLWHKWYEGEDHVYLLGSGAMSKVLEYFLNSRHIPYTQYARSKGHDISQIHQLGFSKKPMIINCCSRGYDFTDDLPSHYKFIDLNYGETPLLLRLRQRGLKFFDGAELFELQARLSLAFWKLS